MAYKSRERAGAARSKHAHAPGAEERGQTEALSSRIRQAGDGETESNQESDAHAR